MNPNSEQTDFTKQKYDSAAKLYDWLEWPMEQIWYRAWRKELWNQIEGPRILELGVGTGKNIPYYPNHVSVDAIDLSEGMLNQARDVLAHHSNQDVSLYQMDAQDLDFPDNTFDSVLGTFVFCSIPDPILALEEALRVTKPGGHLYLLEHMQSRLDWQADLMKHLDTPLHHLSGVHIARTTVQNVSKAGWDLQHVEDLAFYGIFRKITAIKPSS